MADVLDVCRAVFVVQMMEMNTGSAAMLARFTLYFSSFKKLIDVVTGRRFSPFLRNKFNGPVSF